jgi:hypothetical protein
MHALVRKLFSAAPLLLPLAAPSHPLSTRKAALDDGPPNVLVIHREYLKPGKGRQLHERSESAFVHAFADAKSPPITTSPSTPFPALPARSSSSAMTALPIGKRRPPPSQQQEPWRETRPGFAHGWRPALPVMTPAP